LPPLSTKEIIAIWGAGFIHWDYNIIQSVYKNAFIKEFSLNAYFPEFANVLATNAQCFYVVDSAPQYILSEIEMKYALTEDKRFFNNFINRLVSDANVFLLGAFIKNPELLNQPQTTNLTPFDYEKHVEHELTKLGFDTRTTKTTGDQGADVLATKNGVSFAIQCKMYSKPVGNRAVQEANAGRDFYKKDYGVVVSNAGFTKSARQAAHACGIILLNDNQLDDL
jgi:hypothetical protein